MKNRIEMLSPLPLYVCKHNAECKRARANGQCFEDCFFTTDASQAAEPNRYYMCAKPGEQDTMLIREDKLKLYDIVERRPKDERGAERRNIGDKRQHQGSSILRRIK